MPLHAWLPLAHPAAPSHVSALMSGVMTKVAIYGFIRIVFDLLGSPHTWWSVVVLSIGGITAVIGILQAMLAGRSEAAARVQHGRKRRHRLHRSRARARVSSPAEFTGLPRSRSWRRCSTCSTIRCSRACCSTAPAQYTQSTHERGMEHLGGLIHRMPVTAFAFLVGAMAISALPPLNGFVSEWLTFQAILVSPQLSAWGLKFLIPAVGAMLALSAALAAACFVKAYGLTFLGRPRSSAAQIAQDAHPASRDHDARARRAVHRRRHPSRLRHRRDRAAHADAFVGGQMPLQSAQSWLTIVPIDQSRSSYNGFFVFLFIAMAASLAAFVIHRIASAINAACAGVGLRLSGCEPRAAVLVEQFRAADPSRVRHVAVSGPRNRCDAETGRRRRCALSGRSSAI